MSSIIKPEETEHNYPLNCWWVAGLGSEVTDRFLSRRILDMQIVLYRTEGGEVVALEDRCPHRSLPLSQGKRDGDNVVCGYHGFKFEPSGKCIEVPSQASPGRIGVRSYPVREEGPFVWIYTGDVRVIDDVPPPPVQDWISDPGFNPQSSYITIDGNYMLLKENVLDLTHFGYVHAGTFDVPMVKNAPDFVSGEDTVGFREKFDRIPLTPFLGDPMGVTPDQLVDMYNWSDMLSPSLVLGALDYHVHDPRAGQQVDNSFRICHATTPIDPRRMHYWWVFGRNYANDQATMDEFREVIFAGFMEDKVVIESIQRVYDGDERPLRQMEMSVAADRAAVLARRIIDRWLAKERQAA